MKKQNAFARSRSLLALYRKKNREKKQKNHTDQVLRAYTDRFNTLPPIRMIQCSGLDDPDYIAMLENALKENRKVTENDYDVYFPTEEGVVY